MFINQKFISEISMTNGWIMAFRHVDFWLCNSHLLYSLQYQPSSGKDVLHYLTLKCTAKEHATTKITISTSTSRSYRKSKQRCVAQNLKAVVALMNHGFGKSLWELEIRNYDLIKQERLKHFSNKMPLFFQCSILKM